MHLASLKFWTKTEKDKQLVNKNENLVIKSFLPFDNLNLIISQIKKVSYLTISQQRSVKAWNTSLKIQSEIACVYLKMKLISYFEGKDYRGMKLKLSFVVSRHIPRESDKKLYKETLQRFRN